MNAHAEELLSEKARQKILGKCVKTKIMFNKLKKRIKSLEDHLGVVYDAELDWHRDAAFGDKHETEERIKKLEAKKKK
jgi:hypothetical protein